MNLHVMPKVSTQQFIVEFRLGQMHGKVNQLFTMDLKKIAHFVHIVHFVSNIDFFKVLNYIASTL